MFMFLSQMYLIVLIMFFLNIIFHIYLITRTTMVIVGYVSYVS